MFHWVNRIFIALLLMCQTSIVSVAQEVEKLNSQTAETASVKEVAEQIKRIIKNSKPGEIKSYSLDIIDDQGHTLLMKNDMPILYMTTHWPFLHFDPLFDTIDPIKDASYKFTIYSNPIVHFEGSYDVLRELVFLVPTEKEYISYDYINSISSWQNPDIKVNTSLNQHQDSSIDVLPDVLQKEQQDLLTKGFKIEYVGKYSEQLNGLSDVDIYWAKDLSEVRNGFPIIYAVHENVVISKIEDVDSFKILEKARKPK